MGGPAYADDVPTLRHGLRAGIAHERFDRLVVAAAGARSGGFHGDDIAWLLDHAPGEVVIIRPEGDDRLNGGSKRKAADRRRAWSARSDAEPIAVA